MTDKLKKTIFSKIICILKWNSALVTQRLINLPAKNLPIEVKQLVAYVMDPEQGVREQKNKICNQIFKVNTGTTHPG